MEDPIINKSFSALTFSLISSYSDYYSPPSHPYYTSSNTASSSLVLISDPSYCYY
jgi:hypothetical protein